MGFIEYVPKKGSTRTYEDYITFSNMAMRFSKEFWEMELNSTKKVKMFFDKETNVVGFVPSENGGLSIFLENETSSPRVTVRGFTKYNRIFLERVISRKVVKKDGMYTFNLVMCPKVGNGQTKVNI